MVAREWALFHAFCPRRQEDSQSGCRATAADRHGTTNWKPKSEMQIRLSLAKLKLTSRVRQDHDTFRWVARNVSSTDDFILSWLVWWCNEHSHSVWLLAMVDNMREVLRDFPSFSENVFNIGTCWKSLLTWCEESKTEIRVAQSHCRISAAETSNGAGIAVGS
jgi:hypothetical protein